MAATSNEFEPSPRRVRVRFNGEVVAESRAMWLLREPGRTPVYAFPAGDVREELLQPGSGGEPHVRYGQRRTWHVEAGGRRAEDAAYTFHDPPAGLPDLADFRLFQWRLMDGWFEEDEEIYVHARDPYKRVDVVNSSRHVRIAVDGETLADSRRPRVLFETGLPPRNYLPREDVRMELLEKSDTLTACPYKGEANYYSVRVGETVHRDIVWTYRFPVINCAALTGLLCFFNEKVDLHEDGVLLPRPRTPWS